MNLKIGRLSWNIQIGPHLKIRTGKQKSLSEGCGRKSQNRESWQHEKCSRHHLWFWGVGGFVQELEGVLQEMRAAFSWQLEGNRDLSPTTTRNWILPTMQIRLREDSPPRAFRQEHRPADTLISALWTWSKGNSQATLGPDLWPTDCKKINLGCLTM